MSWRNLLDHTKNGIRATLRNASIALREHDAIKGKLAFNEFTDCVWIHSALPWDPRSDRPWNEHDDLSATEWLQEQGIHVGSSIASEAANLVAYECRFHPIVEWLEGLTWDHTPRLSVWLTTYLGVAKSPLADAFGRAFLISAVARVMRPGCKVDHLPILEGRQGTMKSTALQTLVGDDWFTDQLADVGSKDSCQDLRGKWIIELSELSALHRREVEKVKAYITRRVDHYRPSYARRSVDFPRQTVFVGTTNAKEYLSDSTGGRRFWPVQCTSIDIPALAADREQLWAEAVHAYHQGEAWWLTDETLREAAEAEQELRRVEEPWEAVIADWLESPTKQPDKDGYRVPYQLKNGRVTNTEILTHCIGMPTERQNTSAQMTVGRVLARLGWKKIKSNGRNMWERAVGDTQEPAGDTRTPQGSPSGVPLQPNGPSGESNAGIRGDTDSHTGTGENVAPIHHANKTSLGVPESQKHRTDEGSQAVGGGRKAGTPKVNGDTGTPTHDTRIGTCCYCRDTIHHPDGLTVRGELIHARCNRLYCDAMARESRTLRSPAFAASGAQAAGSRRAAQ